MAIVRQNKPWEPWMSKKLITRHLEMFPDNLQMCVYVVKTMVCSGIG